MAEKSLKPRGGVKLISENRKTAHAVDFRRVDRQRKAVENSRTSTDKHAYFAGVAEARYVLRKVFRIAEEQAKAFGIDPLAHQALIQLLGSPKKRLQVNQLAERLDISPAFASSLVKTLANDGLVTRTRNEQDQRVTVVGVTVKGAETLVAIDREVEFHVHYFAAQLGVEVRESALSTLMFYVGLT
ncbi:MAG: helix-turn-helix domain-containing protein [Gammaproteobacteria bacterium]|nr:helix-turn-helix domain-containing protein [Gammaproteobacteria bacterium]